MSAQDWMVRGYSDGRAGKYEPPNHPTDRAAYDHGQKSAEDDRRPGFHEGYFAQRRAEAQAIIDADTDD